ncbi:MAG: ABC transporter substrate-binding protein [Alphaproteobacteria bacterium]|nr:ABC transporter substrate-binding protein [Alphaproteobacteria bacterium]MBV9552347.1 ABC transporter substrate-binding protein [Alphaproteobacteria bacterium]
MKHPTRRSILAAAPAAALVLNAWPARAKDYGPGVTDTEIKIGNTAPYSGPASSYGTIGKAQAAYWKMVNEQGGINGRKINFISYDDGYTPPKTVEMIRKLVEQDEVLCTSATLGTPTNSAIWQYMNQKKVPQLFVATGATKWNDPKGHPWTIAFQPNYQSEGHVYAAYILANKPNAKIGVLYQNDDFGKDYLKGVKDGLGAKATMIINEAPYETTDPTVDSQIVGMKAAGCDVFVNTGIPKFAAQAIRKAAEIDWKPLHILSSVGNSVGAALKPAGLENAKDIISDFYLKDPTDPAWQNDQGLKDWTAFMDKYYPEGDKTDVGNVIGYCFGQTVTQVLKQCGDNLTRENVMKEAANLHDFTLPMTLPGIKLNTSASDFAPIKQVQMAKFSGERWELFGSLLNGNLPS